MYERTGNAHRDDEADPHAHEDAACGRSGRGEENESAVVAGSRLAGAAGRDDKSRTAASHGDATRANRHPGRGVERGDDPRPPAQIEGIPRDVGLDAEGTTACRPQAHDLDRSRLTAKRSGAAESVTRVAASRGGGAAVCEAKSAPARTAAAINAPITVYMTDAV